MFQERNKLLQETLKVMDERWDQRVRDSADHRWSEARPLELQLEAVRDFYNTMHDENTMEIAHCVVCYEQIAPIDVVDWNWAVLEPLYRQVEWRLTRQDLEHFACRQCFPREGADGFSVCRGCSQALKAGKLPRTCQVNNLGLGCTHRYPEALKCLTPLEERLIGLYIPCGWITKFQIDIEKATNGRYRKHKKGHITVFPNDVENLVSKVLPHPMVDELERIHVCFVAPRKPVPTDIAWMMSVNPQRLKRALAWLKRYNPLYRDICISEKNLRSWGDWCAGTEVPEAIFDNMVPYDLSPEDEIRAGHYVSAAERGREEQPVRTVEEVLAMLEHREDEAVRQENESNARLGGLQTRYLQTEELDPRHIEQELAEMVSTGMLGLDTTADHSPRERLRLFQAGMGQTERRHWGGKRKRDDDGIGYSAGTMEPFIINRRGEEHANSNDPDFFPKTFPCLFPWGRGGPKVSEEVSVGRAGEAASEENNTDSQDHNFTLQNWARHLLRRHGGLFATHPAFPFLIYNMLVRSENRRISYIRMKKRSFARVEQILRTLTAGEIEAAEEEYRRTRTTTNEDVSFVLRELSAFGHGQHMSNEERLGHRRKIESLSLMLGMKSIWFTINPNDLTNEVNIKLTAYRVISGEQARQLVDQLRKHIGRVQHIVRDPVSAAKFFDREIRLFFNHCVRVGEQSIFGKVSGYYGCVETNERGAEHLHGFLWLDANVELPTLLDDMQQQHNGAYAEQVCRYIDALVSECCDEREARQYRRWDSVFGDISDIVNDADRLANVFENEANWVAHRCQLHSCGATCVKYSFKEKDQTRKKHPCRFKAPWALREKTEFTPDGLLHIKRNHSRINNYNKALAVALRHNHDVRLLVTNAASLAMCYYASNYATKLDTPLWKRAALMKTVREGMSADVGGQEQMGHEEGGTQRAAQVNNKARQFLARTANQIFTSRELSAVEVCSRLLGHPNHYSSVERWQNIHLNTLYWAVFRRWPGLQAAAGSEIRLREAPETISIAQSGVRLPLLEAYVCRGPLLQDLCFYDYATMIQVRRVGKWTNLDKLQYFPFGQDLVDRERWTQELLKGGEQYVPVLTGPFNHDLDKLNPGYYQRTPVLLLALFVPWQRFTRRDKLNGHRYASDDFPSAKGVWQELSETIPDRVKGIVNNVKLLHKSAEDAKKDATLWASRSEGDEEREHEPAEEGITPGTTWRPQNADMRYSFHDAVHSLHSRKGITKDSPVLAGLLQALDGASFSDPEADPCTADTRPSRRATVETMTKPEIGMVRAAQLRLHKARVLAIEGDDEDGEGPNGDDDAGFGDGNDHHLFPPVPAPLNPSPTQAHTWVDIAPGSRFFQVGEMIGKHRTLNRMQKIALGLICEAMDRAEEAPDKTTDDDGGHRTGGPRQTQHLQYIGGSGGTGKSWLIDTLKEVFAAKGASKRIVITATSGTAAAGIGGNTIHSALGLAFKAQDGGDMESLPPANLERHRQRWRRRDALVVDEVSMLGLKTLYELDHKLRALRGFPDRPFGGMPVVVFTGDFLQFGPVLQKGLLSNFDYGGQVPRNLSERATQYRWQQLQAKKTWEMFTSVVILEEQKRAEGDEELIGLLDRIRTGQQTAADLDELNSRYDSDKKLDFTGGRRAIIPLNRHRWDLTLCAALAFGEEHDRKVSLFLCDHRWKTRVPTEEEMEAALLLGDDAQLPIPGILPYVEGMPVIVNQNKYLGLKVVNGAEFTAAGVVANEEVEERVINERLSIFLGPPSGILLRSQDTEGLAFPHIPPGTLMLGTETVQLHKEKHGKHICPRLAAKPDFRMGLTRTGLPCVPGFALTDYKAQSRTLEKVLLGLYGRKETKGGQGTDKCDVLSLYVQLSRCKRLEDIRLIQPIKKEHFEQARMHPELVEGLNRLKELARQTVERFEARHGSIASVTGEVA